MKRLVLASLFTLCACATSPYDAPYSLIQVDPARSADPNVIPVIINRVDDRTQPYRDRAVVAAGMHEVVLDVPPRKGFHLATQVRMQMETKPCMRYYISARLDTPVTQEWKPIVRSVERIGECEAKFKVAGVK
jgi:hypothetical protein